MSKKPNPTIDLGFLQGQSAHTDLSDMFASSVSEESDMQQAVMVKIDRLLNNPYQPRLEILDDNLDELAQVIKAQGFQGVLIGRPDPVNRGFYQLTAGHRRREAALRAGLTALPLVIRDLTDEEMVTLAITENIQREDLTPLEEGKIFLLMNEEMGYTQEQIAQEIGRERGYVVNRLRVAKAPRDIQALVQIKPDSLRMVANLVKIKSEKDRARAIKHILDGEFTVEDVASYVKTDPVMEEVKEALSEVKAALREAKASGYKSKPKPKLRDIPGETIVLPTQGGPTHDEPPADEKDDSALSPQNSALSAQARIGNAKLNTAFRALITYQMQTAKRADISDGERDTLASIKEVVEELVKRFGAGEK